MKPSTSLPGGQPDDIPQTFRDAARWLLHRIGSKVPRYVNGRNRSGKLDGERDTAQLAPFDAACAAVEASSGTLGLGFALGGGFYGGDLDNCRNPVTGALTPQAQAIVDKCDTYVEVSQSGKGLHVLTYDPGGEFVTLGANGSGVEFYSGKRYFIITGNVLKPAPKVWPRSAQIIELFRGPWSNGQPKATTQKPVVNRGRAASAEWPGFAYELRQLKRVPCELGDYDRWRDIGMIIKLESGAAEEGFDIWHTWSKSVAGYVSPEDCRKYWDSFKNDHPNPLRWPTLKKLYLDVYAPKGRAAPPPPGTLPMVIDSAGDLFEKEIAPVERLTLGRLEFTPGVTVLAGKPKHGKSWLAMGFAVAFTTGDEYVESRPAMAMQAVYVACDDSSRRRFANRLRAFKPKMRPDGLLVITSIDPKAGSSLELLGALLKTHPAIRFVVIDTLSAFRESQRSDSPYQQEYDEVLALNDWAHDHNVAVLLVHHLRKGEIDINDPYESISGTLGLQGACDGLMVLYRRDLESDVDEALDQKLAGLWYRGRDLDNDVSTGIALADGRWTVFGRGRIVDVFAAATRREILRVLESDPARWWTAKEIHAAGDFHCKPESVKRTASRMARSREINAQPGHGGGFKVLGAAVFDLDALVKRISVVLVKVGAESIRKNVLRDYIGSAGVPVSQIDELLPAVVRALRLREREDRYVLFNDKED